MGLLPKITKLDTAQALRRKLIADEAAIGGQLFGPVPEGHRREFFCLDEYTWIWHEEWLDAAGQRQSLTTRYEVRPNGVLKSQANNPYRMVTGDEAFNLYQAVDLYERRVGEYYAQQQAA
ncbi:MAG: hypothetical protein JWN38_1055 [Candidatus Saccharibacteria bacterium]|nr:hypothetical protein [Candidatus Saccharibacteria bacterium]